MKLKDLLNLNDMKYTDKVDPKHQKKMDMSTELLSDDMRVPFTPFPENSSKDTLDELEWLSVYNGGDMLKRVTTLVGYLKNIVMKII